VKKFSSRYFTDDLIKVIRQTLEKIISWTIIEVKNHINSTLASQQKGGRGRLIEVAVE